MGSIKAILNQLSEQEIAKKVAIPHDEARMAFSLRKNTVNDFRVFEKIIGEYYNYHYVKCVSRGGSLPASESQGRAKEIIEHKYRSRSSDIQGAYNAMRMTVRMAD